MLQNFPENWCYGRYLGIFSSRPELSSGLFWQSSALLPQVWSGHMIVLPQLWTNKENLLLFLQGPVSDDWFAPPLTSKLKVWNTLASTTHIILELWGGGGGRCAFGGVSFLGPISALLIKWLDAFVEGISGWVVATLLLRPVSCSCSAVLSHPQIYHTFWIPTKNIILPKSKRPF